MISKEDILKEIFENDPLGLLNVKPKKSAARTSDEKLAEQFDEINDFFEKNKKEPELNINDISGEYRLFRLLEVFRENQEKMMALEPQDKYGLLNIEKKGLERKNFGKLNASVFKF